MTTVVFFGFFASCIAGAILLWAGILYAACRLLKQRQVTFRRCVAISIAVSLAGTILQLVCLSLPENSLFFLASALAIVLMIPATWVAIRYVLGLSWGKSIVAGLSTLLAPLILFVAVKFVVVPYAFQAFKLAANSMAPTLLGEHIVAKCPDCGQPAYASPHERGELASRSRPGLAICEKELKAVRVSAFSPGEFPSDRLFVNKFLTPRRWDLVVFREPANPEVTFVKRLVGLPGETIVIKDGAAWADGKRLNLPEELSGLEYVTEFGSPSFGTVWGTESTPAVLAEDEYFVLGDFSLRSRDSRLWSEGAPGHPPYAVPASYVIGVGTHIYWPPGRYRIFR